ncbi:MAG TPA: hypothetical protein VIY47_05960 [Ignavibacteriaceae bacterium]
MKLFGCQAVKKEANISTEDGIKRSMDIINMVAKERKVETKVWIGIKIEELKNTAGKIHTIKKSGATIKNITMSGGI